MTRKGYRVTADTIVDLLITRHSKDVCVPYCKTGASSFGPGVGIIDVWAMKKSWSNPQTFGYEIKVSRSDFIRDNKWHEYLRYCSNFYFATPPGVIEWSEIPEEVGLVVTSANGTRLYTKKKAPTRTVEIPEEIFRYILMWRTQVVREIFVKEDKVDYWRKWLNLKGEKQQLGHRVSSRIRRLVDERIRQAEVRADALERENQNLRKVKEDLEELGFPEGAIRTTLRFDTKAKLEEAIGEACTGIPQGLLDYLKEGSTALGEAHRILKRRLSEGV